MLLGICHYGASKRNEVAGPRCRKLIDAGDQSTFRSEDIPFSLVGSFIMRIIALHGKRYRRPSGVLGGKLQVNVVSDLYGRTQFDGVGARVVLVRIDQVEIREWQGELRFLF